MKYDVVYVWVPAGEYWTDEHPTEGQTARELEAWLESKGHRCVLGSTNIGPPEGPPR